MTTVTLSTGKKLNVSGSVLETLGRNGYKEAVIVKKGSGGCYDLDGSWIGFTYIINA